MTIRDFTTENWEELGINGYVDLIGPLLRSKKPGDRHVYGLLAQEKHENRLGTIHGGVLAGLLDQVIAITAWDAADRQPTVTVQMDIRFLGAAKAGAFLEARAAIKHSTRSLVFVDADITCEDKKIATGTAVMKIIKESGQRK